MKVKLEDIIEAMEFANMETEYYYDTHNEKVLMLFDGMVDGKTIRNSSKILKRDLSRIIYRYRDNTISMSIE